MSCHLPPTQPLLLSRSWNYATARWKLCRVWSPAINRRSFGHLDLFASGAFKNIDYSVKEIVVISAGFEEFLLSQYP